MEMITAAPVPPTVTAVDAPGDAVVEIHRASKRFGERILFEDLDLTIRRGEFVALLGASGSGKTTLLRILLQLDRATAGDLAVAERRSVVFQEPRLLPFNKVWRNVLLGAPEKGRADADEALASVGLDQHAGRWPKGLSGGEQQRVALARALVRAPELLLLDEPFASLDALTRIKMHDLVLDLWREHRPGTLLVTHDVDEALLLADRVLVLRDRGFSLDATIDLPRPRRAAHPELVDLRSRLLAELGVPLT